MSFMLTIFSGAALSFTGSLPPGLINLSVTQTAIANGWRPAFWLAGGAAFAEFFQAVFALIFTDWFLAHEVAQQIFRWVSVPIFFILGFHFFFWARPLRQEVSEGRISSGFFYKGLIISAFNLLAIPYWVFYCAWLKMEGWLSEGIFSTLIFSLGVSIGTFLALSLFVWIGLRVRQNLDGLGRFANKAIGLIFIVLGVWQLVENANEIPCKHLIFNNLNPKLTLFIVS